MDDINRYFEILGLKPGASLEEIKQAYKDLLAVWNPSRFNDDPQLKEKASAKIKEIDDAYEKLILHLSKTSEQPLPLPTGNNEPKQLSKEEQKEYKTGGQTKGTTIDQSQSNRPNKVGTAIRTVRDSSSLTKWVKIFLYASITIDVIAVFSGILQYQLLSDFQQGVYSSISLATAAAEANDKRQQIISIFRITVYIITSFLFLRWIYRANYNARQLGAKNMKFTSGWSIGWYFIPIWMLWKPYQAMKEIWKASKKPDDWETQSGSPILPWWWFFYIMTSYLGVQGLKHVLRARLGVKELNELIEATEFSIAFFIFSIPFIILTIVLVSRIYEMQASHYGSYQKNDSYQENMGNKNYIAAWIFGIIGLCIVAAIVIPYYVGVQERARNAQNEQASAPAPAPKPFSLDEFAGISNPAPAPAPAPSQRELSLIIPANVKGKWAAVIIVVTDKATGKTQEYALKLNSVFKIPNSDLKISVGEFIPDFKMDVGTITSASNDPNNPAVNMTVLEGSREIFKGWLYSKSPDIHPMEDPRYNIFLKEGIATYTSKSKTPAPLQAESLEGIGCKASDDDCEKIGLDYYKSGEYDKAIEIFSQLANGKIYTTRYFVYRGNCYLQKGDNEKAISDFKWAAGHGDKGAQEFLTSKGIGWPWPQ